MKKVLLLLLLLPVCSLAQVRPGIPISEVVREAQAEIARQKGRVVAPVRDTPVRATSAYDQVYEQRRYVEPSVMKPARTARIPRTPRTLDNSLQDQFHKGFGLSLSTNGLEWLMATPNLEVGLKYDRFSLLASGSYAFWDMPEYKFWRTIKLDGEVRYDIIPRVYVGLMYSWCDYNFKLSSSGDQGLFQSLGVVAGYRLPIGRKLAFDFGLGLGYALIENEKYHNEDATFVSDSKRTFGYWGPVKARVSFVWNIL